MLAALQLLIASVLAELTTKQSNTPQTTFATHSSKKAAMAFQVSKTMHNSRSNNYFANPRKHGQKPREQSTNTLSYTLLAHARGVMSQISRKHNTLRVTFISLHVPVSTCIRFLQCYLCKATLAPINKVRLFVACKALQQYDNIVKVASVVLCLYVRTLTMMQQMIAIQVMRHY